MAAGDSSDGELLSAAFTCRVTAGMRAVELERAVDPIIVDPLARHLAGPKALAHVTVQWADLEKRQGPGKHFRVPARSRLIDDRILQLLADCRATEPVQVVCLGAGMDTRPWRLAFPCPVHYFEVDQLGVHTLKEALLAAAGAQLVREERADGCSTAPPPPKFPLKAATWSWLGADLSQPGWLAQLQAQGFDPSKLTIWVAEALIYYLTFDQAVDLVKQLTQACRPGSWFVLTCIDPELYDTHLLLPESHPFARLWHFHVDQLVPAMEAAGFKVVHAPESTHVLAKRLYGAELYQPTEYSGYEALFACCLQPQHGAA